MPWSTIIHGTAIVTNSIFSNCLPDFCREIQRYQLPIECPFSADAVSRFVYNADGERAIQLKSGWKIDLTYSVLTSLESPEHEPRRRPVGTAEKPKLMEREALKVARDFVAKAGVSEKESWVGLRPHVKKPLMPLEPYFEFEWFDPHEEDTSTVTVAVDCRDGQIVYAHLSCLLGKLYAAHRSGIQAPQDYQPPGTTNGPPPPEIKTKLVAQMRRELEGWSSRLGLPDSLLAERTEGTNATSWRFVFGAASSPGYWISALRADGWELGFRDGNLFCWKAPDAFFESEKPPDLEHVSGRWRVSEADAVRLARAAVRDLSFKHPDLDVVERRPDIQKPKIVGSPTVPRYLFEWRSTKQSGSGYAYLNSIISVEVDADSRKLKSLSLYVWEEGEDKILVR